MTHATAPRAARAIIAACTTRFGTSPARSSSSSQERPQSFTCSTEDIAVLLRVKRALIEESAGCCRIFGVLARCARRVPFKLCHAAFETITYAFDDSSASRHLESNGHTMRNSDRSLDLMVPFREGRAPDLSRRTTHARHQSTGVGSQRNCPQDRISTKSPGDGT
jgi:hypothetical protein